MAAAPRDAPVSPRRLLTYNKSLLVPVGLTGSAFTG